MTGSCRRDRVLLRATATFPTEHPFFLILCAPRRSLLLLVRNTHEKTAQKGAEPSPEPPLRRKGAGDSVGCFLGCGGVCRLHSWGEGQVPGGAPALLRRKALRGG